MIHSLSLFLQFFSDHLFFHFIEARPIFMKANCLVTEMVNFIGHFQYYIASEVVEESWRKFQNELKKMESLEKVLQAHSTFLESMQFGCMLNTEVSNCHPYLLINDIEYCRKESCFSSRDSSVVEREGAMSFVELRIFKGLERVYTCANI